MAVTVTTKVSTNDVTTCLVYSLVTYDM